MSRTTRCLFALGLSASLAAACGDDDAIIAPGGSGGTGGSGGSSGSAGDAGSGGDGGSSAGPGGSGDELPDGGVDPDGGVLADGGPDTTPDGGNVTPPVDAGPQPTDCPDLDEASQGADTSVNNQFVIITRLVFVEGNIEVTFRGVNGGFDFALPLVLCTGSEDDDCDPNVADLVVGDGGTGALLEGDEVTFTTPLGNATAASGEIALVNGLPSEDPGAIIRAYVNWGDYDSVAPTVGGGDDLEARAIAENANEGVWVLDESVDVGVNTTIYAIGNDVTATAADNWAACTQVP